MSTETGSLNYRLKHLNKIFYENVVRNESPLESSEEEDPLKNYHENQENAFLVESSE